MIISVAKDRKCAALTAPDTRVARYHQGGKESKVCPQVHRIRPYTALQQPRFSYTISMSGTTLKIENLLNLRLQQRQGRIELS